MKILLVISTSVFLFASCEKLNLFDKKDKPCTVLTQDAVPTAVVSSFQTKHPSTTVKKWFNKDDKGYAASFTSNGKGNVALFDNNGNFQEELENDEQGDHQDNDNEGCDCETEDND